MLSSVVEKRYSAEACYKNFYAGNDITWSDSGQYIYCMNGNYVNQVDVNSSQTVCSFGIECNTIDGTASKENFKTDKLDNVDVNEDSIYCFAMSQEHLVIAHASGLLRLWDLCSKKLVKLWKSQHRGPVVRIEFSTTGKIICTSGGADSTLRIWDYANNNCLCVLRDFEGPALVLRFHPSPLKSEIYVVGADNTIYCWDYESKAMLHMLRGHISQVTSLSFQSDLPDCSQLVTVSRDKVLIVWQFSQQSGQEISTWSQSKVIPLYEELEGAVHICNGTKLLVACGSGKLKLIDTKSWKARDMLENSDFEICRLLYCPGRHKLMLVTTEQNMIIYDVNTSKECLELMKQIVGFNDEILDMCFLGDNDRYLAVATNSKLFKLYDTKQNMNCRLVSGHSDTVMSLAASQNLLISVGKDCRIHLWKLSHESDCLLHSLTYQDNCHTANIGCVAVTHNGVTAFASASQDGSMKVWQISRDKKDRNAYTFSIRYAALAHDKEVNCVSYALNNKILATASQDKTAKLWTADSNVLLGVLRGHTRGVWCVRFSPVDQIVLTSSSDCSMRIWSIANFTCLKRLEQECTILRSEFLDHGKYILSAGSDGLLKLWNIKTNTCVQTIDEHSDRVWSVAVSTYSNSFFYTGGADSKLIRFTDITETVRNEASEQRQTTLLQEQKLYTLLNAKVNLEQAFKLALTLEKPKASYDIICHFVQKRDSNALYQLVNQLNIDQRLILLQHVKSWGTNSRHSYVANIILKHLLGYALVNTASKSYSQGNMIEVLAPYVQRHFKRVSELNKDLALIEFIVKCM